MEVTTNVKITDISLQLGSTIWSTIREIDKNGDGTNDVLVSVHVGTNSNDTYSATYSFALKSNPNNTKVLNIFIIQNINNDDFCIIISSGENDGMKVLFRSMNKFPIVGIEKYLPNIIKSTISILK